jgi:uncharacterized protein (DUF2141 family)
MGSNPSMSTMKILWLALLLHGAYVPLCEAHDAGKIYVTSEVDSSRQGKIYCSLYNSKDTFLTKAYKTSSNSVKRDKVLCAFRHVPTGTYSVGVHHDENNNRC